MSLTVLLRWVDATGAIAHQLSRDVDTRRYKTRENASKLMRWRRIITFVTFIAFGLNPGARQAIAMGCDRAYADNQKEPP